MAKALSMDLRERVLAAVDGGVSRRAAARRFGVGASSAIRWCAQEQATGGVSPKAQGGDRRSARIEAQAPVILAIIAETPDITLEELRALLAERGERFGVTSIWRFFDRRKITLKKRPRMPPSRTVPTL
jgi:transposase